MGSWEMLSVESVYFSVTPQTVLVQTTSKMLFVFSFGILLSTPPIISLDM